MKIINASTITEAAIQIATYYHEGQTRKGTGVPYITHPIEVWRIARDEALYDPTLLAYVKIGLYSKADIADIVGAAAVLHDVLEDCADKGAKPKALYAALLHYASPKIVAKIIEVVETLTKFEGESYFDAMVRVKGDPFACLIKRADLRHNMSDLAPGKLRDKYMFAQYYLTH